MRDRRPLHPRLECLETLTMLSVVPAALRHGSPPAAEVDLSKVKAASPGDVLLNGTADGTFFAHGNANTGKVSTYSLFASGRIAPVGGTLLVGGFQPSGSGAFRGNLIFALKSVEGNLDLRLTADPTLPTPGPNDYEFSYQITGGSGFGRNAHGSGTVTIALQPATKNIQRKPVSDPGFFGNATLTFAPAASSS